MEELFGGYNAITLEHLKHPKNKGEMECPDGVGEARNPACGDTMRLFIRVETDRIVDVKFLTFGCGAAIACSSVATEIIKGKTIEEALMISDAVIAEAMGGLPPTKVHCSILAEQGIRAAISDYRKRHPVSGKEGSDTR